MAIPAFCVFGGIALRRLLRRRMLIGIVVFALILRLNVRTFLRPVSMHPERATTTARLVKEEFVRGLWDVSLPVYRQNETAAETSLRDARELIRQAHGRAVVICGDSPAFPQKVSWYLPDTPVWNVSGTGPATALLGGAPGPGAVSSERHIPLGHAARVLWIPGPRADEARREWNCIDDNLCWLPAGRIATPEVEDAP